MYFILSELKCHESATSNFRNHLWSAKEKKKKKNNKKKNKLSNLETSWTLLGPGVEVGLVSNILKHRP